MKIGSAVLKFLNADRQTDMAKQMDVIFKLLAADTSKIWHDNWVKNLER
jgi:hypothetical protein